MRTLEEASFDVLSELILGGTRIPADFHGLLAARLSLIAMVADLSVSEDRHAISRDEREFLRQNLVPPPDYFIHLCCADVPVDSGQHYHADAFRYGTSKGARAIIEGTSLVATFLLGKLCVHIFTHAPSGYHGLIGVTLAQLWPSTGAEIDLGQASLLGPNQILQLGAAVRKFHERSA
jgi:hypothetical protein